ncbi:MFS general substrate transporter [Desarmillaria tabescens]|uniref:MFS general substrate transporter n=1 Tax=Armillaria tabescens TaxID=1929756 RepID=A0AA39JMJ1_ARMTA|nr:MFS general substrate transporter [Desarmillaria tabescens]KAK0444615.1 MFS general substrate transporter [Desarmillaria tabescens]
MTISDEQTPLLKKHEDVHERFTRGRKRSIVALVSWCGLLPLFISGSFFPSVPGIARDLDSSGPVISLAVSLSVLAASIGALAAASYSSFYGRRPVYLASLPLLCVGSLGVALSRTVPQLMVWRFLQTFGASPGLSVGAGVIGDIYKLEERGGAMGIFFGACLLGPALAPFVGGIVAHFFSWRTMQLTLGGAGLGAFICMCLFFPETSHPGVRGIDKIEENSKARFVWVNPARSLALLRSPNLVAVTVVGLTVLTTEYVLLTALPYTIGARYNITNQAYLGLCFIPIGLGNLIGAPAAGRFSDYIVKRYRKRRGGEWYPEDRLRGTVIGAGLFVPLSVLGSGLLTKYVPGKVGLIANFVCFFLNGFGVDLVLSPSAAYCVDMMHSRSAESMAANNALRSLFMSVLIAGILPMVNTVGVVATDAIAAAFAWVGFLILWLTIQYGDRMRHWVDVEYSTVQEN